MPEYTPRSFDAALAHDKQCGAVSQLVRVPNGDGGLDAGPADRVIYCGRGVVVPRLPLWLLFAPIPLAWLYAGFPFFPFLCFDEGILLNRRSR